MSEEEKSAEDQRAYAIGCEIIGKRDIENLDIYLSSSAQFKYINLDVNSKEYSSNGVSGNKIEKLNTRILFTKNFIEIVGQTYLKIVYSLEGGSLGSKKNNYILKKEKLIIEYIEIMISNINESKKNVSKHYNYKNDMFLNENDFLNLLYTVAKSILLKYLYNTSNLEMCLLMNNVINNQNFKKCFNLTKRQIINIQKDIKERSEDIAIEYIQSFILDFNETDHSLEKAFNLTSDIISKINDVAKELENINPSILNYGSKFYRILEQLGTVWAVYYIRKLACLTKQDESILKVQDSQIFLHVLDEMYHCFSTLMKSKLSNDLDKFLCKSKYKNMLEYLLDSSSYASEIESILEELKHNLQQLNQLHATKSNRLMYKAEKKSVLKLMRDLELKIRKLSNFYPFRYCCKWIKIISNIEFMLTADASIPESVDTVSLLIDELVTNQSRVDPSFKTKVNDKAGEIFSSTYS